MLELLAELKLGTAILTQGINSLSGGEKQRIALMQAMLASPEVMLVDEPTSALDPRSEERVAAVLASLKGVVSLVVVSHSIHLLDIADEVILMAGGRIVERRSSIDAGQFMRFLETEEAEDG
jgi:ABC-type polar amino acid transport system ATPase subunit